MLAVNDFNSLAPCGANRQDVRKRPCVSQFQLTRPVWGEPRGVFPDCFLYDISTHSPRVGRTGVSLFCNGAMGLFQLTRPVWGEPLALAVVVLRQPISTHSPRVGRTLWSSASSRSRSRISTHSPRVGRTRTHKDSLINCLQFQLTRPVWGEPSAGRSLNAIVKFQLTRPVWGEPSSTLFS